MHDHNAYQCHDRQATKKKKKKKIKINIQMFI